LIIGICNYKGKVGDAALTSIVGSDTSIQKLTNGAVPEEKMGRLSASAGYWVRRYWTASNPLI
jgi:hypothetical protein